MHQTGSNHNQSAQKDTILLKRISNGDESALADLYDYRGRLVYSLALNIVGTVADAEEVTQEVFLKVWRNAASFDLDRGDPMAWIVTITRRAAIDRTRSKGYKLQKRSTDIDEVIIASHGSGDHDDPTDKMLGRLQEGKVRNNLSQLTGKQLEVIHLSYYESMSHSEVSEHLNIPLGTVKSRLREGINQLRRIMEA